MADKTAFLIYTGETDMTQKTYIELRTEAENLMREAEIVRKAEIEGIVKSIKDQMKQYNLTVADLGGVSASGTRRAAKAPKSDKPAKYRGPNGETWAGGLGRKPEWVRAILAEGKSIDAYLIVPA